MSKKNTEQDFWDRVDKTGSCWIWLGMTNRGYGKFFYNKKHYQAHRLSYEFTKGSVPQDRLICHSCDNRLCVNPDHLWPGTIQDNNNDKVEKGRQKGAKGSSNVNAKFTEEQILEIRNMPGQINEIAKKFGVSRNTISGIRSRKSWRHI